MTLVREGERERSLPLSRPEMETVAVVGLGLMGGSLALALRGLPVPPRVIGIEPDPERGRAALEAGAVQELHPTGNELLGEADTVVYATPLTLTGGLLGLHASYWDDRALITDLISLKTPLVRLAEASSWGNRFVGAHPMCGGEASGFGAARGDLYQGANVWLCAGVGASPEYRGRAEQFWARVGGVPRWEEAEEHDRQMAWVSHLPQLLANALAGALDAAGYSPAELGPGGRDMTRLAGSNPEIWKDLLEVSAPVTGLGLTSVSRALDTLADLLARREVDRIAEFMERTRRWKEGGR